MSFIKGIKPAQPLPSSAPVTPDFQTVLRQNLDQMPLLRVVKAFWDELADMRDWWPLVLPLLFWVGWRTYRKERRQVLHKRHTQAQGNTDDTEQQATS
jgi:hypothetical protein